MSLKRTLVAGLAIAALSFPQFGLAQTTEAPPAGTPPAAPAPADPAAPPAQAAGQVTSPLDLPGYNETAPPEGTAARAVEQNWLKVCNPTPDGKRACLMRQVVLRNGRFMGSFVLRDDPGESSRLLAIATAPIGVLLPFGLTWQIDGGPAQRLPYMICDPNSCATQQSVNENFISALKRGSVLTLTAKNRQNQDLVIAINLAGFTMVYDREEALTLEQFQQQVTGAASLEQMLQDRAEAERRRLEGANNPAAPTPPAAPSPQ